MPASSTQPSGDIFEMILDGSSGEPQGAQAKPSDKDIPDWHEAHTEGKLAVDVLETADDVVVISTLAGATTEKLEVYVHDDLLTIRGVRHSPADKIAGATILHHECYWGTFSRTVVLPVHVHAEKSHAEYHSGVLTVRIPKREVKRRIEVTVVDD